MKKVFYFSVSLLILVLIFLAAYNFAFRNNINSPTAAPEKNQVDRADDPVVETEPLSLVITSPINESVLGAAAGDDGSVYYYSLDDRAIKKSSTEGKDKSALLSNLPDVPLRILWSPKRDRALLLLKQANGQSLWYFTDLQSKTLVPLRKEMSHLAWNNLGDKIFYQYTDPASKARTLNIANPDGTQWKKIAALHQDVFIAPIPQSSSVSFWNKPNALKKTYLESVSVTGENARILLSEKFGADYLWSLNGAQALVSTSDEQGGSDILLNAMNADGGEFRSLSIPTIVSKTVWSKDNKTVYYALPGALPENALLPDDYFDKPLYTKDTFWKIDTTTGKKTRLVDLKDVAQHFDSTDLFLTPNEDILFFTDRTTRRLYRIDL